jgi:hypothetical protein
MYLRIFLNCYVNAWKQYGCFRKFCVPLFNSGFRYDKSIILGNHNFFILICKINLFPSLSIGFTWLIE